MSPTESRSTITTTTSASVAVLVAVVALALSTWLWGGPATDVEPTTATGPAPSGSGSATSAVADGPVGVLHAWDRDRAEAWAAGDAAALAQLYVDGSRAGERDVAMLRRWTERGLRVHGMRMQVLRVDVRRTSERRLVLVVTDRLTGAVAVRETDGARWDLPADRAETRRLVFRQTSDGWQLAGSYAKPLATIAATSGSDIS